MQFPPKTVSGPLRRFGSLFLVAACVTTSQAAAPGAGRTGEQIYRQECARCHGASGEGSAEAKRPLAGDKSVPQLARLIAKTMPEDDPETVVGEDAERVAAYIHESFYSKNAQSHGKRPRIELSRLTVRQYQNAVADLIGEFRGGGDWGDKRGLRGEYFKSRDFRDGARVIDRIDPDVRFDFEENAPDPDGFDPNQFSIRWEGSVLAPETGDYEFVVHTEHATRLWVNDTRPNHPLIDAWVKSGNDTEYRGSIRLLGGRAYPVRLEFSKAKQGVDDSKDKKKKPKPTKASVALLWKLPHRVDEPIPAHNLSPNRFPETFVVTTPFPPDDRSVGYERGTSVSKAWDQATTDAAIEVAGYVATHLRELGGDKVRNGSPEDRRKALRGFCVKLAERAFRRPLTDEQKAVYVDRHVNEIKDDQAAVKRVVLLVLKSPGFLYHETRLGPPDGYDVAARLALGLWDSLPDRKLLEAAALGKLGTRDQVAEQAERMVTDLRTRAKLRDFFLRWLRVDQTPDIAKDPTQYPGFDAVVVADLRTSLDLFLEDVVWGESSDFRQLLVSDRLYLNGRLSKFYGGGLSPDDPFQKVALEPSERAGVISHPYLMATFAYTATSSPIHRGVFLSRSVLGRSLRQPPVAVAPLAPDLHAGLSTRERVALQTSPKACMSCHGMINGLGFGLEHFDAVGRFRSEEKGKPVDASGNYETNDGEPGKFAGARELASLLAGSEETHTAFVEQVFHHLVKQPVRAYGPDELSKLRKSFAEHGYSIRKLAVEILATSALTARDLKP